MNRVFQIGNLTRNPELRHTGAGVPVCSFYIAVNRRRRAADGAQETDFFKITAWRELGESCARYLSKGKKVAVSGELRTEKYRTQDGAERTVYTIDADEVEFLSPKDAQSSSPQPPQGAYTQAASKPYAPPAQREAAESGGEFTEVDDELPF